MGTEVWDELRTQYPWPDKRPGNQNVAKAGGWLHRKTMDALRAHLSPNTRYVVELGTWLGKSARFILGCAPQARLVCIDHWEGSPELKKTHGYLFGDRVYYAFLHHNWDLRDRIVPLRMEGLAGIEECRDLPVDLVYVDTAHDAETVYRHVLAATKTWSDARLVGDDWEVISEHYAVADGVADALNAAPHDYDLHNNGKAWWAHRTPNG